MQTCKIRETFGAALINFRICIGRSSHFAASYTVMNFIEINCRYVTAIFAVNVIGRFRNAVAFFCTGKKNYYIIRWLGMEYSERE